MINDILSKLQMKKNLFVYFVDALNKWNKEINPNSSSTYSKLQLQKLLFLASAINADKNNHEMLDMFNDFYALPYGPVEMDIYEAMNSNTLKCIKVSDRYCRYTEPTDRKLFLSIPKNLRDIVDVSIKSLKQNKVNYFSISPFELVEITHKWSAWKDAYAIATLFGSKQEPMTKKSIIESKDKSYNL